MFAGADCCHRLIAMQLIGRADVDHVDLWIAQHLVQVVEGLWNAILVCIRLPTLGVSTENSLDLTVGLSIDRADHAGLGYVTSAD
jgi:hypothetical protein